jgi:hypothetical protein
MADEKKQEPTKGHAVWSEAHFARERRPFKAGQTVYSTLHTGEKVPFVITSNQYKMMRLFDRDTPHVHVRPVGRPENATNAGPPLFTSIRQVRGAPTGRPIGAADHADLLDRMAAVNEFHHKQPRDVAEDGAYREYQKQQHIQAAATHLAGMKAAHGAGDMESARKHSRMYEMHLKKLGHSPYAAPPPEVRAAHAKAIEAGGVHEFKPHTGDTFLLDGAEPVKAA